MAQYVLSVPTKSGVALRLPPQSKGIHSEVFLD